ncbi:MAG: dihydroorotate dehydrogenase (quinone) [Verrucomicrobia bacterium]|nr:dihydroorotate dehydrogenase (quinone) [Verrucomicrobiota bacterium]
MSWWYKQLVRPALFEMDSEAAHNLALENLARVSHAPVLCEAMAEMFSAPPLPVKCFGLDFPNPVGLAAGMDKRGVAMPAWAALGFGFSEAGGVTWHEQPGNPQPRMFRGIPDEALVNRMGFNNGGAPALAARLSEWKQSGRWPNHPVGINLGKSKITPNEQAAEDYANSFRTLLRQLQDKSALDQILLALQQINSELAQQTGFEKKPVLVKVAPDLTFDALDEMLELVGPRQLAGIVATNTTIARPETKEPKLKAIYAEMGGLSGRPLRQRSTDVIRHLYKQTQGKLPLIGVGGIFTAEDAWEKICAGASLVQIYTGMVYEGPGIAKAIVKGLKTKVEENGMKSISDAVGTKA